MIWPLPSGALITLGSTAQHVLLKGGLVDMHPKADIKAQPFTKLWAGKTCGAMSGNPTSLRIGISTAANLFKSASDSHTSITRQPFGVGPATCDRRPFTGQSESVFSVPPLVSLRAAASYWACVAPGHSNNTPIAMTVLPSVAVRLEAKANAPVVSRPDVNRMSV